MQLNPFQLHKPQTVKEAALLFAQLPDAKLLAGGTFLINHLRLLKKKGLKTPTHLISLRHIAELKNIAHDQADRLSLGAMNTFSDLMRAALVINHLPNLITMCQKIGTTPIRNMGTLGGNLTCRYTWTEMGAVMMALDAQMHFTDKNGQEHSQSAADFYQTGARTDKIFTRVVIPNIQERKMSYRRIKRTLHLDIPILAVCVTAKTGHKQFTDTRVVINTGTTMPQRDQKLEGLLNGQNSSVETAEQISQNVDVTADYLAADEYKQDILKIAIRDAVADLITI